MKTLIKQIKEIYLNDERVISIGFSGGKDSTVIKRATHSLQATVDGVQDVDASINDGDECRTLLEGISGEQSGCSQSSRYGYWICSLRSKDKTLNKLGEKEAYIEKMERIRNELMESVSYNMGSWSNRDVYMHGKFKEKIYDKGKEHRKGMRIAGGYKLDYQKEIFGKLMELERYL